MGVRKVVTRSGLHVRGHFPSYKMGRMVSWESQLERKCILYLEYSSAVLAYEEQPLVLEYSDGDGNARRAIPDFSVRLSDGSKLLLEVKPSEKLLRADLAEKLRAVGKAAREEGYSYLVVTDLELNQEPLLSNLKDLIHHRPPISDLVHYKEFMTCLPRDGINAGEAASRVGGMVTLRRMQSLHLVHMNLRVPFNNDLAVMHYEGGSHEFLLH